MSAKFSSERVCKCKGDQEFGFSWRCRFSLRAGQRPTDKTELFVVSECHDPENYRLYRCRGRGFNSDECPRLILRLSRLCGSSCERRGDIGSCEEERFSRDQHDNGFPSRAIDYCLSTSGLTASEIDTVVYYENTALKWDRIVSSYVEELDQHPEYLDRVISSWIYHGKFDPRLPSRGTRDCRCREYAASITTSRTRPQRILLPSPELPLLPWMGLVSMKQPLYRTLIRTE